MKIRHKKLIASGIALSLAGVLGAGALLQTSVSVQASYAMMPGIEQIVKDTSEEKPFKILEIVDDTNEAEIGYYVSGQEPYVKLYEYKYTDSDEQEQTMKFQSLEEGLSKLPTSELRKEFANGTQTTNIKQIQNVCYQSGGEGQDSDYPLSYSEYREKYILSPDEKTTGSWENDWKKIDFTDSTGKSKSYEVQVKGNYQENTAGTGDYTKKEQQYYPIRQDANDAQNKNEKVRENIQNFYYTGSEKANSPYFLTFEPVSNSDLNSNFDANGEKLPKNNILADYNSANGNYGYYENVYEDLTAEIVQNLTGGIFKFPGENPSVDLNGAKKLLDTSVKNGTAFSSGEDEFMSVDDTADQTQATQQDSVPEVPQAEEGNADSAFSDGDFTSGADAAETEDSFDSTGTGTDLQESAEPDNNVSADANTISEATAGTEDSSDNVKSNPLLSYVPNKNKDGTIVDPTSDPSNPLVYYGETIDQYPFYKYTMISNLKAVKIQADKNTANIQNGTFNLNQNPVSLEDGSNRKCNVTLEDGQYWFWIWEGDNVDEAVKYPVSIVTCRQPVSYNDVHKIPTELGIGNYYYKVSAVYFCCKKDENAAAEDTHAYKYYGWYSPSYADESNPYIHEDAIERATYYVSDAEYELTPGTGNYDFVPDDNAPEQTVEVDHLYYQGGYTNHDWFKKYVFHLEPGEEGSDERKQFDGFKIEVETMTLQEFNSMYGSSEKTTSETQSDDISGVQAAETTQDINAAQSEEQSENQTEDQTTEQIEDQTVSQNEGDTSEVDQMVSEAGVELVSIEKELAEATDDSISTDEFQDGTSVDSQTTEDSAQTTNNISDTSSQTTDSASDVSSQISDETDTDTQFTDNSADAIDDAGAFSAGDTVASNTSGKLAKYGLIYVNSSSISQAAAKEMSNIPTIINAAKLTGNSTTAQSFAAYIKGTDQDSDGHYVNTLVYVFKNTFAETNESTHQSSLINVNFHTNFNPNASGDSGSTTSAEEIQGFEEILEYIESENKYRKLGQTTDSSGISDDSDEVSDGETVTPTPANAKIPLLKRDISQARTIEYIINYNLKRALNTKKSIRVLEIEPAKISDDNKNGLTSDKVSEWLGISVPEIESSQVCCTGPNQSERKENMFDGKDNDKIWHSNYEPHNQNDNNGHHYIKLILKNPASLSGFNYKPRTNGRNGKIVTFQVVLKFQNGKTYTENGEFQYNNIDTDTTLKKFRFANDMVYQNVKEIQINILTAGNSEGNKENNAKFASCSELSLVSGTEVTVDTMTAAEFVGHTDDIGSKYDMIYIGDQKNNDHDTDLLTGSGEMCYAHVGAVRNAKEASGDYLIKLLKLIGQLDKDYKGNNPNANYFAAMDTYSERGAGYFRGSGNDITPQICSELKEFVQSGYPVVFASGLMKQNQDNKSRVIDNKKVDASSYYYEFMSYALKYDNVFVSSELKDRTDKLTFFSNLAKPVIKFTSKPPEPPRANDSSNVSDRALIQDGQLKYVFSIENDSDAAPAVTTYDCNLYLDLNFDGNLSEKEDQSAYIQIADSSGQVLSRIQDSDGKNHYHLRAGQKYTLTRKLPESYYKIITWKLEISSNRNSYIHISETGYAKQGRKEGAERQTIKVLQMLPSNGEGNWKLDKTSDPNNSKFVNKFQNKLTELEGKINFDFDIQVTSIQVSEINAYTTSHEFRSVLNGYDILIIGFDDMYSNIDNDYNQVDDILDFIKSGKSVIFSHDTTSYINYNETVTDLKVYIKSNHLGNGQYYSLGRQDNWGLYLNKLLRSVVGMDRYGITLNEDIPGTEQKASDLLRKGNELNDGGSVSFKDLMKLAGDVAYKEGTRLQSYAQTQGYSNEYLREDASGEALWADKVNDGAITQYPYVIGDKIKIGNTHSQYYQLGLEQDRDINGNADGKSDVVVWYTLTGGKYNNYPKDVRNYYYFYSKGNVIYTGAGHSKVGDCEEEVNLFINAITAAANVTAVEPKASFVKGMNPNAGVETTKYYMTDQTTWNEEQNVVNNDIDLYLNIKEYNMVSADLSQSDLDKQEMTIKFYIENENGTEQTDGPEGLKLKDITDEINTIWEYGGSKDGIKVSNDTMFHTKNSSVYSLKLSGIEKYLKKTEENGTKTYKNNCKVYAKVSSTVYLYGKANTRTVWTSINLKQRQLFDLD
ncbi:DUF5057 domain-containing protein [Blautia difficilis]|uniref:DUF5057 domain-containing protein n=1 Tax=Blautia difficilis TaxID=2763027 RepID=UPI003D976672